MISISKQQQLKILVMFLGQKHHQDLTKIYLTLQAGYHVYNFILFDANN